MTACKSNLKNLGTALEQYAEGHDGAYPPSLNTLTPDTLKALPHCPSAAAMSYTYLTGPNAPGNTERFKDFYHLECQGEHHTAVSLPANYPQYNAVVGIMDGRS